MKTTRNLSWGKVSGSILVIIMILSTGLFAQDNPKNSLVDGSWSMQFRIANNLTLSSFEGALISAKKHLSDKSALRFGVAANYRHTDYEYLPNDDESKESSFSLNMKLMIVKYISPKSRLSFYYGIGPQIGYSRQKTDAQYADPNRPERYTYRRYTNIGMLGSWGLEWFITSNLSLLAEYGGGFQFQFNVRETYREPDSQKEKSTKFEFYSSNVNFGLSVYF